MKLRLVRLQQFSRENCSSTFYMSNTHKRNIQDIWCSLFIRHLKLECNWQVFWRIWSLRLDHQAVIIRCLLLQQGESILLHMRFGCPTLLTGLSLGLCEQNQLHISLGMCSTHWIPQVFALLGESTFIPQIWTVSQLSPPSSVMNGGRGHSTLTVSVYYSHKIYHLLLWVPLLICSPPFFKSDITVQM